MKLRSKPPPNEFYYFYIIQLLPEEIEGFFSGLKTAQKLPLDYLLMRFEFIGNPNQYLRDRIRTCMLRINPSIHIAWMDKYCIISNTIISNPRHIPLADIRSNRDSIVVTMRGFRVLYIPQLLREESIYNSNADIIIIGESNGLNIPSNWESVQYSIEDGGQRCLVRNDSIYYPNSDDWISIYPDIGLTVINFPDLRLDIIREAYHRVPCIQRTRRLMRLRQPGTIHCSRNHKAPLSTV
jgi:hypothetical protein